MAIEGLDVLAWQDGLAGLKARLGALFRRRDARRQAGLYLEGLLSVVERKNGWQLAEAIGDARPWRTQRVLSQVHWDQDAARDLCRDYVLEHLADEDGVLVIDETGFLKKGSKSAGVARQYSGTAGRIENCQIGVFLGYAGRRGHALIDRELYLPKEWAEDRGRRTAAFVPDAVTFATKPALAQRMIARALDAAIRCPWVLGDEIYGSDRRLRMFLEQREQPFVLAVRGNETLWSMLDGKPGSACRRRACCGHAGQELALPERRRWCQGGKALRLGAGAPGSAARAALGSLAVGPPQPQEAGRPGLLRRVRPRPDVTGDARPRGRPALDHRGVLRSCQAGNRARRVRNPLLAWLVPPRHPVDAGARLPGRAAGAVQGSKRGSGHRLSTLVPLSVPELRRLLAHIRQALRPPDLAMIFAWSLWRRAHQALAKLCHWKHHMREMQL